MDKRTRAVILEFSVYNAQVNYFLNAYIMFEFVPGGGATVKWRFDPCKLIRNYATSFDYAVLFAEVFFSVSILFFTLREAWEIKKQRCSYFFGYWNMAELILLLLSYAEIGMYFYKQFLVRDILLGFEKTGGNRYTKLDGVMLVDEYYIYMLGFIMFISCMKLMKLLKFNKRMNVLALTISMCWDELSYFIIAFAIIFFSFASLFYFIFFMHLREFSGILQAVQTTFSMMLGKFEFNAMKEANQLSPLLFFVFSVSNSMVLINIMMSIILGAFNVVQGDMLKQENKYDVMNYLWRWVKKTATLQPNAVNEVPVDEEDPSDHQQKFARHDKKLPDKVCVYI